MRITKYKTAKYIFLLIIIAVTNSALFAQTGTPEDAIREIERKRAEIEQELREKEKAKTEKRQEKTPEDISPPADTSGANTFILKSIIIENDEHLSRSEKQKLTAPFLNREISVNDITLLVRSITNLLIDKGYATSRVKVPVGQNLSAGQLTLSILNGRIETIEAEKKSIRSSLQIFTAFPFYEGQYLNVRKIEYGLEQMNRLASNNAAMKIEPGTGLGMSKIIIYNQPSCPITLEPGFDNLGQKSTGETRAKLFAGIDNLLSINDSLFFNYAGNPHFDDNRQHNRSYTVSLLFPLGQWNLSGTYSRSEYMQKITGLNAKFKTSGNDTAEAVDVERLMFMKGFHRLKVKTGLTLKSKKTFIEDTKIDSSSVKLSVVKAGLDYSCFLFGGYFSVGSFWNRGLSQFNAKRDEKNLANDVPRAQFTKYDASLLWNRQFELLRIKFAYTFSFYGQYSMDTLYNSEKISAGDLNTVRGFKESQIMGDHGFYIRNDFTFGDFSFIWRGFYGLKFFAGYDYGQTEERSVNVRKKAAISGWSAGLRYTSSFINFNITYARKITAPDFASEKSQVVYFAASLPLKETYNTVKTIISHGEAQYEAAE